MPTIVGLKELRQNIDTFADHVRRGKSFIVVRKSKPLFKISPPDDDTELWEIAVDFTKFRRGGVPLADILSRL